MFTVLRYLKQQKLQNRIQFVKFNVLFESKLFSLLDIRATLVRETCCCDLIDEKNNPSGD